MTLTEIIAAADAALDAISSTPEYREYADAVDALYDLALAYVVDSDAAAESAAAELGTLKTLHKHITDDQEAHSKRFHGLHKKSLDIYRPHLTKLGAAESKFKGQLVNWQEVQRRRAAEEARLAREAAEAEAKRLREEAEARMREAEEAARLQRTAEDAGDTDLADALAEQAAQLEELAQERKVEAETIPTPQPKPLPKLNGITSRETWSAEVTDLMALVRAVAAGTVPLRAIQADMTFLRQQAVSMKSDLNYPGVKAVSTPTVAGRAS